MTDANLLNLQSGAGSVECERRCYCLCYCKLPHCHYSRHYSLTLEFARVQPTYSHCHYLPNKAVESPFFVFAANLKYHQHQMRLLHHPNHHCIFHPNWCFECDHCFEYDDDSDHNHFAQLTESPSSIHCVRVLFAAFSPSNYCYASSDQLQSATYYNVMAMDEMQKWQCQLPEN